MNLQTGLQTGLQLLGLDCSEVQQQKLIDYLALLEKWNRHFNLTAVRDVQQMLAVHLLDSLSIAPFIHGKQLLDVGTGAGLPGIPLAIFFPEKHFTLLDGNGKKIRFCRQAIHELELHNVVAEQQRVEDYSPNIVFDQITTRAFSDLPKMLGWLLPLMQENTELLAMKGQLPEAEIAQAQNMQFKVIDNMLKVPFLEGQRHLLQVKRG